jgi:hypothetical protein
LSVIFLGWIYPTFFTLVLNAEGRLPTKHYKK